MPGVLPAVGAAFFVSGISALVYQIAWQRILALHSGVGIYSIAMIVAAFMAGLGASAGAWLTPWFLIRYPGSRGAIGIAAAGNVSAGLAALALYAWLRPREANRYEPSVPSAGRTASSAPSASSPPRSLFLWIGLYASSGFCALALEIVWFRLIDVAVKSRAYTFGTVLAIYLLGAAAGSLAGAAV